MASSSSSSAPAAPFAMTAGARDSLAKWEQENQIQEDQRYQFDLDRYAAIRAARPWRQDPIYFKKIRISAVALIKMSMHAVSGDNLEIMGLLVGFVEGDTIFVVDSFELPVVGIEYQVNPGAKCDVFLTQFREASERIGKNFATIGWYHSHPGFNCFLSKTDCETQTLYQNYQEPFVAVVVDPKKTMHAGKVEIGAFRCYPAGYEPPEGEISKFRIPLDRVEDFGAQANKFYPLELSVYKSTTETQMLELLWTQYWLKTLCASPLIVGRDLLTAQVSNLTLELSQAETKLVQHGRRGYALPSDKKEESVLQDVAEESADRTTEIVQGLLSQVIKDTLFNRPR